jgi:alginate O-acetyltransferase complex protein AlgI
MLFNSGQYLFFFLITLGLCWMVAGLPRLRLWILLLASYYFYAANNHWLILLILISTQIDYFAGRFIAASQNAQVRKRWLIASVCCNLGILGVFKYFNFFAGSVADLAASIGLSLTWTDLHIALPVGISFYTFQSMSYTIDVYRNEIPCEKSWLRFSFYVAFFPQLIAGPIVRARDFLPQVRRQPRLDRDALESALFRIARGLIKKIVLADFLALYADAVFSAPESAGFVNAWIGVYAFSFQIYFDFSGYSDIAIGSSRLIGYELPENFMRPYATRGMAEFWRRWHISLSSWLRDYLYISLGGNRMKTRAGVYRNIFLTMLLGGLWHGAAFTFVFWGALHGLLLIGERALGMRMETKEHTGWRGVLRRFLFFHLITFTWIPFRGESAAQMAGVLKALIPSAGTITITAGMAAALLIIAGGWLMQLLGEYTRPGRLFRALPLPVRGLACAAVALLILVFNAGGPAPFIYFQF